MKKQGHLSLADFWAQHNEHRIVTGRLLGLADLYSFGGRNVSLFAEIVAVQLFHLVLLLVVIRRVGWLHSVSAGGWGLSQVAGHAPTWAGIAGEDGTISGHADLKNIRPDVAAIYPNAKNLKPGWDVKLDVPGAGVYHAFLVFEDRRVACPVAGELRIGHYPVFRK
ncbi:MAG: hypothetical protein ACJ74Y_04355 [Bryobacteraceae bacterium]